MRISAWRSDVCASDLPCMLLVTPLEKGSSPVVAELAAFFDETLGFTPNSVLTMQRRPEIAEAFINLNKAVMMNAGRVTRSEEHTSELQSLMRNSYAVFCLKKHNNNKYDYK